MPRIFEVIWDDELPRDSSAQPSQDGIIVRVVPTDAGARRVRVHGRDQRLHGPRPVTEIARAARRARRGRRHPVAQRLQRSDPVGRGPARRPGRHRPGAAAAGPGGRGRRRRGSRRRHRPLGSDARPVLAVDPGLAINLDGQPLELGRRVTIGFVRPDRRDLPGRRRLRPLRRRPVRDAGARRVRPLDRSGGGGRRQGGRRRAGQRARGVQHRLHRRGRAVPALPRRHRPEDVDEPPPAQPPRVPDVRRARPAQHARSRRAIRRAGARANRARRPAGRVPRRHRRRPGAPRLAAGRRASPSSTRGACAAGPCPPSPGTSFVTPAATRRSRRARRATCSSSTSCATSSPRADAPSRVRATDVFRYLPPAGVIPIASSVSRGFDVRTFFEGLKVHNRDPRRARPRPRSSRPPSSPTCSASRSRSPDRARDGPQAVAGHLDLPHPRERPDAPAAAVPGHPRAAASPTCPRDGPRRGASIRLAVGAARAGRPAAVRHGGRGADLRALHHRRHAAIAPTRGSTWATGTTRTTPRSTDLEDHR